MGGRFRAARGHVSVSFSDVEVSVLRGLLDELIELLASRAATDPAGPGDPGGPGGPGGPVEPVDPLAELVGIGSATTRPEDPALARLFPDAYRDDPEAASDFRRYTEESLRARKEDAARTALATLESGSGRRSLRREQALAWLGALNDLRLALGERLHVTEDWDEMLGELDPDDPRTYAIAVYDLLTGMQDSLVRALD